MARPDWLRTFLAVYRSGSVTDGARIRAVSQPAASQQLASLERAVGAPLFLRTNSGVVPTERGMALYAQVASPLDQLEGVLTGLDGGRVPGPEATLRVGSSAEYFSAELLPRMVESTGALVARFGPDEEILHWLEQGELDLAVTSTASPRRSLEAQPLAHKPFVLVAAAGDAPPVPLASLEAVGEWLRGRDWAAYSLELPITRRFWQQHLGHPFSANLRLVVPDLRAVVSAVARGVGCSILPTFVCAELLASGRIVEVHPVSHLIPPEQWYLCTRQGEAGRSGVAELAAMLLTPLR